jgi:hypothetical protein
VLFLIGPLLPARAVTSVMIVYKDLFSGDEAISDSYKIVPVMDGEEEVPGLFEVSFCAMCHASEQLHAPQVSPCDQLLHRTMFLIGCGLSSFRWSPP